MANESWHLSKGVPISFLLGILAQTVALAVYINTIDNNVKFNKTEIDRVEQKSDLSVSKLEDRADRLEVVVQSQAVTMARMDENIKAIRDAVERMVTKP